CALVISPLISLMQDQVHTLRQRQIPSTHCGSGGDSFCWSSVTSGHYRVVYMSPEFALGHLAEIAGVRQALCVLAIDEAHCISAWGHDFRPVYQQLGRLREALGQVPTMCLTATCTKEVRHDIQRSMGLLGCVHIVGPMNRPNLKYIVQPRRTFEEDMTEIFGLSSHGSERVIDNTQIDPTSSTIVYVQTKARCEELAALLSRAGVAAASYHAGLPMQDRSDIHRAFLMDELQVVVATVAFGMGIDKASIRRVIHYGAAHSLESYVQQCGRAGRDGEDAECITFFKPQDLQEAKTLILQGCKANDEHSRHLLLLHSKLAAFLADSSQCRRVRLLQHFGEEPHRLDSEPQEPRKGECIQVGSLPACCSWCDVCEARKLPMTQSPENIDFTQECRILLQCVSACGGFTGSALPCALAAGQLVDKLKARNLHRHPTFGSGRHKAHSWWKAFLPHVLRAGLLEEKPAKLANGLSYAALSVSEQGFRRMRSTDQSAFFRISPVPSDLAAPPPKPAPVVLRSPAVALEAGSAVQRSEYGGADSLDSRKQELYRRLSHVRQQWMRRLNIMGESLVSNPVLRMLAEIRPSSVRVAQQTVPGLPQLRTEPLASLLEALVSEVNQMCREHFLPQQTEPRAATDDRPPKFRRLPTTFGTAVSGTPSAETLASAFDAASDPQDVRTCDASPPEETSAESVAESGPQAQSDDWLTLLDT
ncbi:WRN, partial [Symbiodinium sp. CCMP2456]